MSEHDEDAVVERVYEIMWTEAYLDVSTRKQAAMVLAALKPGDRIPGGLVVAEAERMEGVIGDLIKTSGDAIAAQDDLVSQLDNENAALRRALEVGVWTEEERDGMAEAVRRAEERGRGHYETLFAVGAWLLRHRQKALDK